MRTAAVLGLTLFQIAAILIALALYPLRGDGAIAWGVVAVMAAEHFKPRRRLKPVGVA